METLLVDATLQARAAGDIYPHDRRAKRSRQATLHAH
jgi:hypothetical protein